MMTNRELVLETMRRSGTLAAKAVQEQAKDMTGTALNDEYSYIPAFAEAVKHQNMATRHAGDKDGFVCRSSAGRVVRLIQAYDSDVFTGEPETLAAQWRFVWSKEPRHAKPFVALSTSPYAKGDCCLNMAGAAKRSTIDNNSWSPDTNPEYWEDAV